MSITDVVFAWAFVGLFLCFFMPNVEWKNDISRRLFIFAVGPGAWIIYSVHLFITWLAFRVIEKETGFKKDDWTE